jgi:predicted HAD superfamily hydrolase
MQRQPALRGDEADAFRSLVERLVNARQGAGPVDFWMDLGYRRVGPLLAGFATWLLRAIGRHDFRDVYFLSRDGHLIKLAFERVFAHRANIGTMPRTRYLYASRRVFNLAAIERLDDDALEFLASGANRMSVRQFLARIEIDAEAHLETVARIGFASPDEIVEGGLGYGRLRALLRVLDEVILARARAEFDVLACYFREEGLLDGGDVAIVDLGWHGSLQDAMARLIARMGGTTTLTGYYLGTFPPAGRYAVRGQVMLGYLCEEGKPDALHAAIKTAVELFEWVFSAPHGSVCNLRLVAGGVEPVFADFAFEAGQWRAASVMQAGALRFVDDYLALWQGQALPHVPPEEAVRNFHAALTRPTAEEARRLGGLQHAEGFGKVAVARPIGMPQGSLWNPFSYAGLVRGYRRAFWQPGYLRNVLAARKT